MSRAKYIGLIGIGLLAGMAALATPARAVPVKIDLTISYVNPPEPEAQLDGTAQFYSKIYTLNSDGLPNPPATYGLGDPIDIGTVSQDHPFVISLYPPGPCFGETMCDIGFSFSGSSAGFSTFAFAQLSDAPDTAPGSAPFIPVGTLYPPGPCFSDTTTSCHASGPIVAYDSPVQIGEWDITISAATPLPAALPLFATGLGAFGLLGLRRKRKPQATA